MKSIKEMVVVWACERVQLVSERERNVCQERESFTWEAKGCHCRCWQWHATARIWKRKKKKTGRGLTRRQQRPSRVAASDTGVAAMEVGVQSNIKKRFLVGRGNWLGSVWLCERFYLVGIFYWCYWVLYLVTKKV